MIGLLEYIPLFMFLTVCLLLMLGYPVAITLAGTALFFAAGGILTGNFNPNELAAFSERVYGIMTNSTLVAVPLFVLMGVMLQKSKIAEDLLESMAVLCGRLPGGLGISVVLVGMLLAASTGIVGATVVTMGLMSLPSMLKRGYSPSLAAGTICATGTLGQIIPPSIALVLLGDTLSNAYQQAQLSLNIFNPKPVSVGDLFMGAVVPGLLLVLMYLAYLLFMSWRNPNLNPNLAKCDQPLESISARQLLSSLLPPILLIVVVLGSIISGAASPTEAAGVGAMGATLLALIKRQLNRKNMGEITQSTAQVTSMVFTILLGASLFSLVFMGYHGDTLVEELFHQMPGGVFGATLMVMVVIFLLGFILDFIEITFVVVPIVGPVLLAMGLDPIWLGIMIALNLQTSFLTPPFGFALFYFRGVAPNTVSTTAIYKGVAPFIMMQLLLLIALAMWPELVTWLPSVL